ncbi:ABC transporter ATP-binding protein [Aeromonas salmonicida]|uniref:ABC transporter ATP-binding protein n=1 Tax=Aeromonas salmonicida TaxID=645 RepID=UPI0012D8BE70|nr:ABC transporter ATP-binding protein [Aeromonas salmonicida]MBS2780636.1 ABC transporter ATP-binding protein [Aeromonas salmonicida]MUG30565.1 ABC transporter ATP-binding protein [Aeromonas salmonicida]
MQEALTTCRLLVENLTKTYRVYDSPQQRLKDLVGLSGRHQSVEALQPLTFRLAPGETVAVIGANGSGKSTLLQLICGTLSPSGGKITRFGRIAALLELGAGFNPEFSGIENIFLNASINGMSRGDTEALLPRILEYADIGEHVYQPVKTYSSGMYVRLAFAVAIHVEPDILIIDEALAVGDEAFQRKCFARLREMQSQGVSILFVSHSAESVVSLCDRALLLDHGQLLFDGEPKQAVGLYQKLLYARPEQRDEVRQSILLQSVSATPTPVSEDEIEAEPKHGHPCHPDFFIEGLVAQSTDYVENGASIEDPVLLDEQGFRVNLLHKGERYRYRFAVQLHKDVENFFYGTLVKRIDGVSIGGVSSTPPQQASGISLRAGTKLTVECEFELCLNAGTYFMNAGVYGDTHEYSGFLARKLDALVFKVLPNPAETATSYVDLGFRCRTVSRVTTG